MTVREILELPVSAVGDPRVIVEGDHLDVPVRWVHHGDVFDVASLLRGGELLLTTGLALGPVNRESRTHYVDQLADVGTAAVALELGRTFRAVPDEMIAAAKRRDLTLIAFQRPVPFLPIMEEVHTRLVDLRATEMRLADDVARLLNDALLEEIGLQGLLEAGSSIVGAPVVLTTRVGRVAAAGGLGPDDDPVEIFRTAAMQADVTVHGERWGTVSIAAVVSEREQTAKLLLERLPTAVVLELLRSREQATAHEKVRRELINDLLHDRWSGVGLEARAGFAGFHPPLHARLAALAMPTSAGLVETVDAALARRQIPALRASIDGDLLLLVALRPDAEAAAVARQLTSALIEAGRNETTAPGPIAVGPTVDRLEEAGRTLREARNTLALARRLQIEDPIVPAESVAVERLLFHWMDEPAVRAMVDELLGPLLAYDAERSRDLVHTLEVFLACNGSKVEAARMLYLRRQSLYRRLEIIEELVGPLDDGSHRAALLVALKARRLISPHGR